MTGRAHGARTRLTAVGPGSDTPYCCLQAMDTDRSGRSGQRSEPFELGAGSIKWWWMQSSANLSQQLKFPDNRENTGNFARFDLVK